MANYAQGDTRITLSQTDVIAGQNNGSLVIDSQVFSVAARFRTT